jgi:hypothetical protein
VVEVAPHTNDEPVELCFGQCLLNCEGLVVENVDIVGASESNVAVLHVQ